MSMARGLKNAVPVETRQLLYRLQGTFRGGLYRGDTVYCDACDGWFRRFLEYRGRTAAQCPRCGSLERHRAAMKTWRESTNLFTAHLRVLHVAPETSLMPALRSAPNLHYVTGDLTPGRADTVVDLTDITDPDQSYDVVIASHVLEHIPDDIAAMREVRRVLADDGWAFLAVPTFDGLPEIYEDWAITTPAGRLEAFGQWDHVRRYTSCGFESRLAQAGLQHVKSGPGWICRRI